MDQVEIKKFITKAVDYGSETSFIEFKDARGGFPTKATWKSVSSFSQKPGGGIIVFGGIDNKVDKKIEIVGITDIAGLQEKFSDLMSNMSFTIRPEYHIVEFDDKTLLAFVIPECPQEYKPCYYIPAGLPNGAYVRVGNTDKRMTDEECRRLIANSKKLKFDRTKAENTSLEEIDVEKVKRLIAESSIRVERKVESEIDFKLLRNLGIADKYGGCLSPTLGGYLIFAKREPQEKLPFFRYTIRCVKYKGENASSDIIDRRDIKGTLDYQIDEIQKFILKNIRMSSKIVGTKRIDKYEYPEAAIREIVANAVIHRDYKITETYTQVNIYSDRLEVFNSGSLPPGVTIDNIKEAQVSRNEVIASLLKDLNYLEEYGRGIDIVYDTMSEWGLMRPIFKNTANSFKVILFGEKFSGLNERQMKVWDFLQENKSVTAKKCEEILKDVPRATINYDLRKMQEKGLIRPKGESIGRFYEPIF